MIDDFPEHESTKEFSYLSFHERLLSCPRQMQEHSVLDLLVILALERVPLHFHPYAASATATSVLEFITGDSFHIYSSRTRC